MLISAMGESVQTFLDRTLVYVPVGLDHLRISNSVLVNKLLTVQATCTGDQKAIFYGFPPGIRPHSVWDDISGRKICT